MQKHQLFLSCLALSSLLGCGSGSNPSPDAVVQRYRVDGVLTQLPSGAGHELMIHHVAIPDFVSASGDTVGMDAMTMGFPVSDASLLDGFAVGDSIQFTFEVRWTGSPRLQITEIEALPRGTPLEFGKVSRD